MEECLNLIKKWSELQPKDPETGTGNIENFVYL